MNCLNVLSALEGEALARAVATPPAVPVALSSTHVLCPACLSLHQLGDRHQSQCALLAADIELSVPGWASGISEALRDDLRRARPAAFPITARVVASTAERALEAAEVNRSSAVIVAVPTGGHGRGDPLGRLAEAVAELLGVSVVDRALKRDKRESTRSSVAQARARIARMEYEVAEERIAAVEGRAVLLIDDTVTTGHTLAAIARLLRRAGAATVLPVAIDRTASPRLLQRAGSRAPDQCPHITGTELRNRA